MLIKRPQTADGGKQRKIEIERQRERGSSQTIAGLSQESLLLGNLSYFDCNLSTTITCTFHEVEAEVETETETETEVEVKIEIEALFRVTPSPRISQ